MIMSRYCLYACFVLLLCLPGVRAADEPAQKYSYSLWYAPLVVLQAGSPAALSKLTAHPLYLPALQATVSHWGRLPVLRRFTPDRLFAVLQQRNATAITCVLLPPLPPQHGILFCRVPGLDSRKEQLRFLRGTGARNPATVPCAYRDGVFYVASSRTLLADYLGTGDRRSPLPGSAWPGSLNEMLARPCSGLRAWFNLPWLVNLVSQVSGYPLDSRLDFSNTKIPPAAILDLSLSRKETAWKLFIPRVSGRKPASSAGKSSSGRIPVVNALPARMEARLSLSLGELRLVSHGLPLWSACADLARLFEPDAVSVVEQTAGSFQLLTGLHFDRGFLRLLGDECAMGTWLAPGGHRCWAFVAEVGDCGELQRSLERAIGWSEFFARKDGRPLTVTRLNLSSERPNELMAVSLHGHGVRLCLFLDSRYLVVAKTRPDLEMVVHKLTALKPGTGNGAPLCWRLSPQPLTLSRLQQSLGTLGQFAWLLQPEQGSLRVDGAGFTLGLRGPTSPLYLVAAGAWLARECNGLFVRDNADDAVGWLRIFLEAEQTYRYLELARLNGRESGYTSRLEELVTGKGEDGAPLAGMFNRIYDFSSQGFTFAQMARVRAVPGYVFRVVRSVGGKPLDPRRSWLLMAIPRSPQSDPALLIDQDGNLYKRRVNESELGGLLDLPEELAGWKRD